MEEYYGSSKYDGRIRRVTLVKRVSDYLGMEDGDTVVYYKIGNEMVIRKLQQTREIRQIEDIIPQGTPFEDAKAMINAAYAISKHYTLRDDNGPSGEEMIAIAAEAMAHYPEEYSNEKKAEMLKISIEISKDFVVKMRHFDLTRPDIRKDLSRKI